MNINDKFLQLPKAVIESYYEDSTKVIMQGSLKVKAFETQFKATMRSEGLSAEKAVYLAMQVPSKALKPIQDCLS